MCLISPALLADTLGAVTEGWGDLFPFLSVKEGGTCRSSCAFLNREYSLLELCWEHYGGQNISSANSVCLVPEQRLFALPGLSQAIAFIQSFKSIGVIMFMAQWLLLKVFVLQCTRTQVVSISALSSSRLFDSWLSSCYFHDVICGVTLRHIGMLKSNFSNYHF